MAMKHCKECRHQVSTTAKCCPSCGSRKWRGSPLGKALGLVVVFVVGLAIVGATKDGSNTPRSARGSTTPRDQSRASTHTPAKPISQGYSPASDQLYPFKLVTILSQATEFNGLSCGLTVEGEGWHKSKFDGVWNAVLRRRFGGNEVSCLLESEDESTVQRVELEAEFHQPGQQEAAMLLQFTQSAQILMHPTTPPREFAEAVVRKSSWSNDRWAMTREPYANGGFGLMLRRTTPRASSISTSGHHRRWEVGALIEAVIAGKNFTGQTIELTGVALNGNTDGLVNIGTRAAFKSGVYQNFVSVWDTTDKVTEGQSCNWVVVVEDSRAVKVGGKTFVTIDAHPAE